MTPEEDRAWKYRAIARKLRESAQSAKDDDIRGGFLVLAEGYERLAARVEETSDDADLASILGASDHAPADRTQH